MRRREFIGLLGGAATWPFAARAQQPAMPVIGYLGLGSPEADAHRVATFRKVLSEAGYVEGRNVAIEYRWAHNALDRLPELAADLVRRRVAVIATPTSVAAPLAAKAATTTIPIVFSNGADPVQAGLVASLNRPGGNVTGATSLSLELGPKRLGLLHEMVPGAARFAALVNPNASTTERQIKDAKAAASSIGRQIEVLNARTNREIDAAFASLAQMRAGALIVGTDQFLTSRRVQLATLAVRYAVPKVFPAREFSDAGGLMSYGAVLAERDRQVGLYIGRILKGEKPADLPVMQPTKFEFILNMQTARTLGIDVPTTLLAQADEAIE
jgi:putative ABC transport system substrate-binding protein